LFQTGDFLFGDTLTLTTQHHQKIRFLEIFFRILNIFAIVSNLRKKFYFLSKPPKITFWTPKLQTSIKPVGDIFDRLTIPYKMV